MIMELYRSGHNEHDWKSCCPSNRARGFKSHQLRQRQSAENTSNQRVFGTFYRLNYFIFFDEIRYFFNIMSVKCQSKYTVEYFSRTNSHY